MESNPYLSPQANIEPALTDELAQQAEEIRRKHINHEAAIQSVGYLYYLATALLAIATAFTLLPYASLDFQIESITLTVLLGGSALLYYWLGSGLRALKRNVRNVAGIFAVLGLFGFPIGTLLNGYILYLLYSSKGKMVFSSEYQDVIDATPQVVYKTPLVIWLIFGIVILAIGASILIPLLSG